MFLMADLGLRTGFEDGSGRAHHGMVMGEQGSSGDLQRPSGAMRSGFIHRTFRPGTVPGAGGTEVPRPNRACTPKEQQAI